MHHRLALVLVCALGLTGCADHTATMTRSAPPGGMVQVVVDGSALATKVRNDGPDAARISFIAGGEKWVHFDLVAGQSTDEVLLDPGRTPPITVEIRSQGDAGATAVVSARGGNVTIRSGK